MPDDAEQLMTTNDLWLALEAVLVAKGASPAWIAYALPDLHIAAKQYAFSQYGAGHRDAREGVELPNPQSDQSPVAEAMHNLAHVISTLHGTKLNEEQAYDALILFVAEQLDGTLNVG